MTSTVEGGLLDKAYSSTLDRMGRGLPESEKEIILKRRLPRGLQVNQQI